MNLRNISRRFDDTICVDAYDETYQISAQLNVYEDSVRDSVTTDRRVLSMDHEVQVPTRNVLKFNDEYWVVGDYQLDSFKGQIVRKKYVLQHAVPDQIAHHTLSTYLEGLDPVGNFYAGIEWVKDTKNVEERSKMVPEYLVYASRSESVQVYDILVFPEAVYLVEQFHKTAAGFLSIQAELVSNTTALTPITWTTRTYDPVQNVYTVTAVSNVTGLEIRWQSFFDRFSQTTEKFKFGDSVLLISKAQMSEVPVDSQVNLDGKEKVVIQSTDMGSFWSLHIRNDRH